MRSSLQLSKQFLQNDNITFVWRSHATVQAYLHSVSPNHSFEMGNNSSAISGTSLSSGISINFKIDKIANEDRSGQGPAARIACPNKLDSLKKSQLLDF
jgi:hypothetical protein